MTDFVSVSHLRWTSCANDLQIRYKRVYSVYSIDVNGQVEA